MEKVTRKFKRLVIDVETVIAKPGNGPMNNGKTNNFLVVGKIAYGGEKTGTKYLVKGLRGWINHTMMALAKNEGIEVCHTSEKTETQSGQQLLPEGFHPTGKCRENGECVKHRLMGSFSQQSKLRFEPVVIVSTACKGKIPEGVQKVHIATENRSALVYKTKTAIQDFGERYFAGEISLKIEFLEELSKEEQGFLLKAILYASNIGLGASVNNGSGKMKVLAATLQEVTQSRWFDKTGKVIEEEITRNLRKEMQESMSAWPRVNA